LIYIDAEEKRYIIQGAPHDILGEVALAIRFIARDLDIPTEELAKLVTRSIEEVEEKLRGGAGEAPEQHTSD